MPSEMFERGKHDAEADALDENYYHYYYDYKLAYDEVVRNRRRSRRQIVLRRFGRNLLRLLPLFVVLGIGGFFAYRFLRPQVDQTAASPTPTSTPRPTLVPPTPRPLETPTAEIALRTDSWAMITGTNGARLRVRKLPGTDKDDVIATFEEGQTVHLLEGPQEANGYAWWRIEGGDKSGWAAATFLQPVAGPPAESTE